MTNSNFPKIIKYASSIKNFYRRHNKDVDSYPYNLYCALLTEINQNTDLKNNYNIRDIEDFFRCFLGRKPLFQMTPSEFESELKMYLYKKPTQLKYYFRVTPDYVFIANKKIGTGSIRPFSKLPRIAKEKIIENYEYENNRQPWYNLTGEEYKNRREDDYYMYIPVEARGMYYCNDVAIRRFYENQAIYYFFTLSNFSTQRHSKSVYCALNEKYKLRSSGFGSGDNSDPIMTREYDTAKIPIINKLLVKKEKNEIEKSIMHVIEIVGGVEVESTHNVIFSLCMNAMESLLTGNGRGDLRYKTSERMAFLLGDNERWIRFDKNITEKNRPKLTKKFISRHLTNSRYNLFRTVNELYTKRSKFVHLDQNQQINEDDYYKAKFLLLLLVEKLLNLLKQNITHCNNNGNDDTASIEHLINILKFK